MLGKIKSILIVGVIKIKYRSKITMNKCNILKINLQSCRNISIKNGKLEINGNIFLKYGSRIGINGGNVSIGKECFFNSNSICICRNDIKIGDRVSIGPNVCIYDHDHTFGINGKSYPDEYNIGTVEIGNNVWIGAGSIILRNTKIGENSIIGAGTVVKGIVPSNSIVINDRSLIIKPLIDKKDKKTNEK